MSDSDVTAKRLCAVRAVPTKPLPLGLNASRLELIQLLASKWVNGTVLQYAFLKSALVEMDDRSRRRFTWDLDEDRLNQVREAFKVWADLGIGLQFRETSAESSADIRIGFHADLGSWSYVGRDIRKAPLDELTMNLGWDGLDTAIHEIGHTMGFPHEHQNPNAGIVWNEEAVYAKLAGEPNLWSREKTFFNIIRKITPDTVQGSAWDPNSIMHYPFEPGLIDQPEKYRMGLAPAGGLSARDAEWAKTFYPAQGDTKPLLEPLTSAALNFQPGEQRDFVIRPATTRDYEIRTFGESDTVVVLFEKTASGPEYVAGDDDSGEDRNAYLKVRLMAGREYVLRLRLYWSSESGACSVMYW